MAVGSWPEAFGAKQMVVADWTQYVRLGGKGPGLVLLHGFGDTGDMWVPLADALVKDHAVIVPDLRGMGLSSHPEGGYEKVAQARDLATILDQLGFQEVALVTHEIGNMVGYAFAALFPQRVTKWVVMDAPLPGIGHWDKQLKNPKVWHFNFRGPDVERLSESCSTASTMSFQPIRRGSTSRRAITMPRFMRVHTPSTTPSADNTPPSRKTLSTINNSSRRAN
jgi:pimeloyl-ACP methyl ester carboxylesterase